MNAAHFHLLLTHAPVFGTLFALFLLLFGVMRKNEDLKRIISKNGAVITEYGPGVPPLRHHFPVRNRIISGLSLATVVVEAGERSGSLITASTAIEQGREVYAVPGNISSPMSAGPNRLIREGARPLLDYREIIRDFLPKYPHKLSLKGIDFINKDINSTEDRIKNTNKTPVPPGFLSPVQLKLFHAQAHLPLTAEELSAKTETAVHVTAAALTALEIQDLLLREADGRYRLKV
jgi:DNA processing protein